MILPLSRNSNIIEQDFDDEVLLYDTNLNKAYSLNKTLAIVYRNCDGKTTLTELIDKKELPKEIILLSINQLKNADLIETGIDFETGFENLSRRETIKKIGVVSMALLPVLSMIIAPTALNAQSGLLAMGSLCITPNQCASNICSPTTTPGNPITFPGTPPITIPGSPPTTFPGNPPIFFPGTPPITIPGSPPTTFPGIPIPGPSACL